MRRIYVRKEDVEKTIERLGRAQAAANLFVNIAVKPYKGKKYDKDEMRVIVVG